MEKEEPSSNNNENFVCPESTVESANLKHYVEKSALNQNRSSGKNVDKSSEKARNNDNNNFVCESTIESSLRRDFIRKAALVTAAAGIGGVLLGAGTKNVMKLPESSASSTPNVSGCVVIANDCLIVDYANLNSGSYNFNLGCGHVLSFGSNCSCPFCEITGEAIGSARTSGAPNRHGLDFYTGTNKRMSITNCGAVGIGVTPCSQSYYQNPKLFLKNNCGDSQNQFRLDGAHDSLYMIAHSGSSTTGASLKFRTAPPNTNCGEYDRVIIDPHGNLGINTLSPSAMLHSVASSSTAKPIIAQGASSQSAHLQEWQNASGSPLSVVDASGNIGIGTSSPATPLQVVGTANVTKLGIGTITPATCIQVTGTTSTAKLGVNTTSPATTLQVNGSVSAKVANKSSTYSMTASDFAVLADATNGGLTVNLPSASTSGMIVHIKKTDGSLNIVTVSRSGSDTIEGATSKNLSKKYASLTLLADGTTHWFVIAKDV